MFRVDCQACHDSLRRKIIISVLRSWFLLLFGHGRRISCVLACGSEGNGCVALRPNEVAVHEKLVFRLIKLSVSTCEAVLWEEFDKLPTLAKAFANVNVKAAALAESCVGFLVADTSLWCLGGNTVVTYAEKAKNVWKLMAKVELHEHKVKASGPRPFAHLKAKAFVNVVKDRTMWLQSIDAVQADFVSTTVVFLA